MYENVPKQLLKKYQEVGSLRALARERDVNYFYVSELMQHGREPTDKTRKGRLARKKLFLPAWRHHKHKEQDPAWLKNVKKNIRIMVKETKQAYERKDIL